MNAPLHTLRTRWVVITLAVAAVAFVAGVSYGLRTGGGILAQGVTPTPTRMPTATPTPIVVGTPEPRTVIRAANAEIITPIAIGIDGKSVEEASPVAISTEQKRSPLYKLAVAYATAEAKFDTSTRHNHYWDDNFSKRLTLTPNLQEYLETHPERAIYLVEIDEVVHLPDGIYSTAILDRHNIPTSTCNPSYWSERCPAYPAYRLVVRSGDMVWVGSAGYVFVQDSNTLPDAFSFLSKFKVWRYSR